MVSILVKLGRFLWEGLTEYASTDEGALRLIQLLDEIEEAGIDVPFYEKSPEGVTEKAEAALREQRTPRKSHKVGEGAK